MVIISPPIARVSAGDVALERLQGGRADGGVLLPVSAADADPADHVAVHLDGEASHEDREAAGMHRVDAEGLIAGQGGPGGGVEYQTCFAAERIDAEVFAHLNAELTVDAGRGGLFSSGGGSNRLAPTPLSRLYVEARPRGLSVQAFHTFPDERAIVRTQALFEVRAARPG